MDNEMVIFCGNNEKYLSKELIQQSNKANGGTAFRIPAMLRNGNTVIAVADRQASGENWGYIELVIRRSEDGGESWSDIETIVSPPARETANHHQNYASAFFVNPCLANAPNGDIILLVDFYPECRSPQNELIIDKKKIPYSMYQNRMYPVLYDRNDNFYLIYKDGVILDRKYRQTEYRVTDWKGSLFRGDEYLGNIYLNGKTGNGDEKSVTTFGAPLKAPKRNYVFMLKSSDNGKTWTDPVDVTRDFLIKEDGTYINVSSGTGLTTIDNRIIMPLYSKENKSISVYSVDDGDTWHRMTSQPYACNNNEWQLVQAPDSTIFGLGKQDKYGPTPISISTNSGKRWDKLGKTDIYSPSCQKSFLTFGSYVFCSHPSEKTRANGVITIGKFKRSKGKTIGIDWISEVEINKDYFGYSCLCQVDDDHIGVLYEGAPSSYILFKKFALVELIK